MTDLLRRWALIVPATGLAVLGLLVAPSPVVPGPALPAVDPNPYSVCPVAEAGGGFSSRLGVSANDGGRISVIAGGSREVEIPDGGGCLSSSKSGNWRNWGRRRSWSRQRPLPRSLAGPGPWPRSPGVRRRRTGLLRSWGCRRQKGTAPRWCWSTRSRPRHWFACWVPVSSELTLPPSLKR